MSPHLALLDLPDALLLCVMAALPPLSIASLAAAHPHLRRLALDVALPAALAAAAGVHAVDVAAATTCGGGRRGSRASRPVTHLSPAVPPPPRRTDGGGGGGRRDGCGGSGGGGGGEGDGGAAAAAAAALAAWSRLLVWAGAAGAAGLTAHEPVTRSAGSTLAGVALRWGVSPGLLASVNGGGVDRLPLVLVPHPFGTLGGERRLRQGGVTGSGGSSVDSSVDGVDRGVDGGGGGSSGGSGDRRHVEVVWFAARRRYFLVRVPAPPPPPPSGATGGGGSAAAGGRDGQAGGATVDDAAAVAAAVEAGRLSRERRGSSATAVPQLGNAVDVDAADAAATADAAAAARARRRVVALLARGAGVSPEEATFYLDDAGGNMGGALRAAREDAAWAATQEGGGEG